MAKRSFEDDDGVLEQDQMDTGDFLNHSSRQFAPSKRANRIVTLTVPFTEGRFYHRNNELSRGAHSIVYRLLNEEETMTFAGKRLLINGNKVLKQKIIDEIEMYKLICKRKHPNIIQMNEYFQLPNHQLYMVLDYANNGTLQSILQYRGKLTELETKTLILQICGGVYWLHHNHIIHGDLKLGNVLIHHVNFTDKTLSYDMVKICDFGHSFINNGDRNYRDHESEIMGTPYYLAPEIICRYRGINKCGKTIPMISYPIDIWSIGVIFFTLLYGVNPFIANKDELHSLSMTDLMTRITSNIIKLPSDNNGDELTSQGKDLLIKLLRQHPLKRITLLEIVNHKWIKDGFMKDVNLLDPHDLSNLNDNSTSLSQYIDALKSYGFGKLLFNKSSQYNETISNQLTNLERNVKKQKKRFLSLYGHKYDHLYPTIFKNTVSKDIPKKIIINELQLTLRNIYEIESNQHKLMNNNSDTITHPLVVTRHRINKTLPGEETFIYQLNNGQFGCILESGHQILLDDIKSTFWYIIPDEKLGWVSKCFTQDIDTQKIPVGLSERLQYINDFKLDMDLGTEANVSIENWSNNLPGFQEEMNTRHNDTFIRQSIIFDVKGKDNIMMYILSDGSYQFDFKNERFTIILQDMGHTFTICNSYGKTYSDKYHTLLWGGNNSDSDISLKNIVLDKMPLIKSLLARQITTA